MAHSQLRSFSPRRYQETIFARAASKNTLVVLPTGLGKTAIAAMLAVHRLQVYPSAKILVLAPTRPLVAQHLKTFQELLEYPPEEFTLFAGAVGPAKRHESWKTAKLVFATPQGIENDVLGRKILLNDVVLLVIDEAHRAVGDYSYVYLAKQYLQQAAHPLLLGLTASPGSEAATIQEVCTNLGIEQVESRTDSDPEVVPYLHPVEITWEIVELSIPLVAIRKLLTDCYASKLAAIQQLGCPDLRSKHPSKTQLLELTRTLHGRLAQGEREYSVMKSISLIAEALKVLHAAELLETQSVHAALQYVRRLNAQGASSKVKALKNLLADPKFQEAKSLLEQCHKTGLEHPKLETLLRIVQKQEKTTPNDQRIIFTQYRDQGEVVVKMLMQTGIESRLFVGQTKKGTTGMSQKAQQAMLAAFREGQFSTLVATSVAEEGLDIPTVNTVIFYEPIPSAIRTVQRRGRTARHGEGQVIVLVTKGTRDEVNRWAAHHKERRMISSVQSISGTLHTKETLSTTVEPIFHTIIADFREKGSPVLKELSAANVKLDLQRLEVGDYRISDDLVIEYKKAEDFINSLVDGRLLPQLRALRTQHSPMIILEGTSDLYSLRQVSAASVRGLLVTILLKFKIPILWTTSPKETAAYLLYLATLYADPDRPTPNLHFAKPKSIQEQQEYVLASLPGIGLTMAKTLLARFGSLAEVFAASPKRLAEVDKIGVKTAQSIYNLLHQPYLATFPPRNA